MPVDTQSDPREKLNDLRKRVLNSEPVDEAEYAKLVREMVGERVRAIESPAPKTRNKAVKGTTVSLDDLLPS